MLLAHLTSAIQYLMGSRHVALPGTYVCLGRDVCLHDRLKCYIVCVCYVRGRTYTLRVVPSHSQACHPYLCQEIPRSACNQTVLWTREGTRVCLYSFSALADPVHVSMYHTVPPSPRQRHSAALTLSM